ncbi:MAG: hypothetical protein ACRD0S_01760, partial [Acidimicrobiales bacterium]
AGGDGIPVIPTAELDLLREEVMALPEDQLEAWLAHLDVTSRETVAMALRRPGLLPHQIPPEGEWRTWLLLAGRDSGKSLASAVFFDRHMTGEPCDPRIEGADGSS